MQNTLDILLIYNKGRKVLLMDQQRNRNIVNILKHADALYNQLQSIPNKNGQVYSKYHRLFKLVKFKALAQLQLLGQQANDMKQILKKNLNQIIEELGSKARRFEQGQRRIKELGRMHIQQQKQGEQQQQRIKQQMLDLIKIFKKHASGVGQDLKQDSKVIESIGKKQDNVLNELNRQNSTMKDMAKKNEMGFFTLIGYSAVAVVLWILTMMLIIIF